MLLICIFSENLKLLQISVLHTRYRKLHVTWKWPKSNYFHKIWTLPAQWIKCSNGDMIIIASCRMAIFVKMIKTIGRWKLEGIGDDEEEKRGCRWCWRWWGRRWRLPGLNTPLGWRPGEMLRSRRAHGRTDIWFALWQIKRANVVLAEASSQIPRPPWNTRTVLKGMNCCRCTGAS